MCRRTLVALAFAACTNLAFAQAPANLPDATPFTIAAKEFNAKDYRVVYFSAEGTKLCFHGKRFLVYDLKTNKGTMTGIAKLPSDGPGKIRLGTLNATGTLFLDHPQQTVYMHEPGRNKVSHWLRHPEPVLSASFSPDGTRVLTVSFGVHNGLGVAPDKDEPKPKDDLRFPDLKTVPGVKKQPGADPGKKADEVQRGDDIKKLQDDLAKRTEVLRKLLADPAKNADDIKKAQDGIARQMEELSKQLAKQGKSPLDGLKPLFKDPFKVRPPTKPPAPASGRAWARIWDVVTGKQVGEAVKISDNTTRAIYALWAPDGRSFVTVSKSSSEASRILFWDADTFKVTGSLSALCESARFLSDGKLFFMRTQREADVYDPKARKFTDAAVFQSVNHLTNGDMTNYFDVSADGRTFAVIVLQGVQVFDLSGGKKMQKKPSLDSSLPVYRVVVSADGKHIATAAGKFGVAGQVRVWDAQTGAAILNIPHEGLIESMQFAPDGRLLVTRNDEELRLWNIERSP